MPGRLRGSGLLLSAPEHRAVATMGERRHPGQGDDAFFPAPPGLSDFVLYLWRRRSPADVPVVVQPTLPHGCIDVFMLDGGPCRVVGPATTRIDRAIPGGAEILGVRLRPGVGARLFGGAAGELVDRDAYLGDLSGAKGFLRSTRHVVDIASEAHRPLVDALAPHVSAAGAADGVAFGTDWLARHPSARIDDLSSRLAWSAREVRRRFSRALGFGPKVIQRMLRLQRALSLAGQSRGDPAGGLSRLALAAGYADQAHMSREFRVLARTTPATLVPMVSGFSQVTPWLELLGLSRRSGRSAGAPEVGRGAGATDPREAR